MEVPTEGAEHLNGIFCSSRFRNQRWDGSHCNCFLKRLAVKLSENNEQPYHITITWIRILLSFEILRSVHICLGHHSAKFPKGTSFMTVA